MTTDTAAPSDPDLGPGREREMAGHDSFAHLVRAEWTKFRTVRGWVIGMIVAGLITVLLGYVTAAGSQSSCNGHPCDFINPVGPGGEAVVDSFYFVHRPLSG